MPKKTIFIVEDDPDISELMQMIVENEGFEVKTFVEAKAVESSVIKQKPCLVITDLSVGNTDGAGLARKLKHNAKTAETRVLLVSAKTSLEEIAREARADGYLAKPFNIQDLTNLVKKLA